MELLIIGLILVALMVFASTRIKKIAAGAFEPESIETENFRIEKPEGFLNVINGDPDLEFEAYSREFGTNTDANARQARAEIRFYGGLSMIDFLKRIEASDTIVSKLSEIVGEKKYSLIEVERTEKGTPRHDYYKIGAAGNGVRVLKVMALNETNESVTRNIESMIASFEMK